MTVPAAQAPPRWWLALPTEPTPYHQFLRAPLWRWWRPIAVVVATVVIWLLISLVLTMPALVLDAGATVFSPNQPMQIGPWFFLSNNVALGLAIPLVMFLQWGILGQRPGWLSSITGRLRWRWLFTCLGIVAVVLVVVAGVEMLINPPQDLRFRDHTWLLVFGILLTTPFQAAGEEYALRGMLTRLVGSYFRAPVLSWMVATAISSAAFVWLHASQDWWLNSYYFVFALAASWVTWRTGGLEAAIAIHVANNLVAEVTLPWMDITNIMDRSAGVGDPSMLIHMVAISTVAVLLALLGRRRGLTSLPVPRSAA